MLIGVDIGGTKTALVTAQNDGAITGRRAIPTGTAAETIRWIRENAAKIAKEMPVEAVGISCGGPLDSRTGVVLSPPNLPGWDRVPIAAMLEEAAGAPARLCNDANACALAEWKFGAGRGTENMIFLTFGTGLGAGLILNGALYEGAVGLAGEAGHLRLAQRGPLGYGKHGSFEGFASGGGIARMARKAACDALALGLPFAFCPDEKSAEKLTAKDVVEAAKAGDADALAVTDRSAAMLGKGVAILMDLFDPERIVIGSIFARAEELFRPGMERAIRREALPQIRENCKVVPAALGDAVGDWAAVAVARMKWEENHV